MKHTVAALALAASMLIGTAQAEASILVDFSFTGISVEPGTITGRLEFAAAGIGVKAIAAYIDSGPSRIVIYPNDNILTALHGSNSFTVTADGNITSASLSLFGQDPLQQNAGVFFQLNAFGGYNDYEQDYNYPYPFGSSFEAVSNQAGFAGVTYTPETAAAVPEPAAWTMMIGGFGVVGAALRRRRDTAKVRVVFG